MRSRTRIAALAGREIAAKRGLVSSRSIEKVTGDSYAHQAAVRIFRPLGMRHTSFPDGPDPRIHGPHNRGYEWIDGKLVDVTDWNMSDRWAAGDPDLLDALAQMGLLPGLPPGAPAGLQALAKTQFANWTAEPLLGAAEGKGGRQEKRGKEGGQGQQVSTDRVEGGGQTVRNQRSQQTSGRNRTAHLGQAPEGKERGERENQERAADDFGRR